MVLVRQRPVQRDQRVPITGYAKTRYRRSHEVVNFDNQGEADEEL